MAKYFVKLQKSTISTTLDVGNVNAAASNPRRFKLYDLVIGSEDTPADASILWEVRIHTTTGTGGTAVTPKAIDQSDTDASELQCMQAPTSNGSGTDAVLTIPLHQRATFRWSAIPGAELVCPAAADDGFGIATPVISTGTPKGTAGVFVDEL